jgi:hypothetical protein
MDVQLESLKNPVTGEEQDTKIQLPTGFIWKLGDATKSKMMRITTPNLNFNDAGKNAFIQSSSTRVPSLTGTLHSLSVVLRPLLSLLLLEEGSPSLPSGRLEEAGALS